MIIKRLYTKWLIAFTAVIILLSVSFGLAQTGRERAFMNEKVKEIIKEIEEGKAKQHLYYGEPFIPYEYIFLNNEGLNVPLGVHYNSVTDEIIVLDQGNYCLYIFSYDGKFKKKIGRPGQGPGEFIGLKLLTTDPKGNIYVYGNKRIDSFSKEGNFIKSVKINILNRNYFRFSVSEDGEIITNNPADGYYISVYNNEGDLINTIGKIDRINKEEIITLGASEGLAFRGYNKRYYVFLPLLDEIRIYKEDGSIYKKIGYIDAIDNLLIRRDSIPMEKKKLNTSSYSEMFTYYLCLLDVVYNDSNIFLLPILPSHKDKPEELFVFNYELECIGKYTFGINISKFGLIDNGDIVFGIKVLTGGIEMFLPYKYSAEVIKYRFNKSENLIIKLK